MSDNFKTTDFDNFKIVNGSIGATVAPGQSFTIPYPAGTEQITFYDDGHIFILNGQRLYTDPATAGITLGVSVITITNSTTQIWANGDIYTIQLNSVPIDVAKGDLNVTRHLRIGGKLFIQGVEAITKEATLAEALAGTSSDRIITPRRGVDQIAFRTFNTIAELQAETPITGILSGELVHVLGYWAAGDGGGGLFWLRTAGVGEVQNSGTTFLLTDTRIAERLVCGEVNVRWFGAKGDGVTNDTAAIQAAVDYAGYISKVNCVFAPSGNYLITNTIHVGYGVSYQGSPYTSIDFYGSNYDQTGIARGTVITANFSDRPAINIQGARGSKVRNMTLTGLNATHVSSSAYWGGSSSVNVFTAANWIDATLHGNANSRYAPYGGIVIDGYSAVGPSPAYPNVTYPSFLGAVTQYSKATSSAPVIDGVQISGFVTCIAAAPSGNTGQCDFIKLNNSILTNSVYGVSVGNTDGREFSITNCYFNQMHTGMVNNVHGGQQGQFGSAIFNTGFDRMIQIMDIPTSALPAAGPLQLINCYSENLFRGGNYGNGASQDQSLILNNCQLGFQTQGSVGLGYPNSVFSIGSEAELIIIGGTFREYRKAFVIYAAPGRVSIEGAMFSINTSALPSTLYEKAIHTVSAGQVFIIPATSNELSIPKKFETKFVRAYNFHTGAQEQLASVLGPVAGSSRNRPICIHSRWFSGTSNSNVYPNKHNWSSVAKSSLANVVLTDRTLTFDFTGRTTDQFETYGPAPGDVIADATTGSVFFVRARTGTSVTAELQNNYYINGVGATVLISAFSVSVGTLFYISCRTFSTTSPLLGVINSASTTITDAGTANFNDSPLTELQAGDRLFTDLLNENYVTDANNPIISIDTGANEIVLTGNLARTIGDRILLPTWVFPPLANS